MSSLSNWVDIVPPAAAEPMLPWLGVSIAVAALLVLVLLLFFVTRQPRVSGLLALHRLRRRWQAGEVSAREVLFQLVQRLQRTWGVARLDLIAMDPGNNAAWAAFRERLRDARFSPAEPAEASIETLLREAMTFVRRAPWRRTADVR